MAIGRRILDLSTRVATNKKAMGALFAGSALAGANAADPLKPVSEEFQEIVFDDPNAIQGMAMDTLKYEFGTGNYQRDVLGNLRNPTRSRSIGSSGRNPSGSIVFGMYNSRVG